jgi:hypothetical protein
MAYKRGFSYWNDFTGRKIEPWSDGLQEQFAKFIRPLLPNGSCIRKLGLNEMVELPLITFCRVPHTNKHSRTSYHTICRISQPV